MTSRRRVRVLLTHNGSPILDDEANLAPGQPFPEGDCNPTNAPETYKLTVQDADGRDLISLSAGAPP